MKSLKLKKFLLINYGILFFEFFSHSEALFKQTILAKMV